MESVVPAPVQTTDEPALVEPSHKDPALDVPALGDPCPPNPAHDMAPQQPEGGALATPFGELPLSWRVLCGLAVALLAAVALPMAATDEPMDLLALLVLLPAAAGAVWVRVWRADVVALSSLFARFVLGWIVALPVAVFSSWVLSVTCFAVVLMIGLPSWIAASLLLLFGISSLVICEELCKYLLVSKLDTHDALRIPRHFTLFSSATSLGMATGECYYLVLLLRIIINAIVEVNRQHDAVAGSSHASLSGDTISGDVASPFVTPPLLLLLALNAMMFLIPMHMLSAYHVGLAVTRATLGHATNVATEVAIAAVMRTCFTFSFFECLFVLNWGAFSSLVACVFQLAYYIIVRRFQYTLPRSYLRRAGYMSFFGYGALPTNDADGVEQYDADPTPIEMTTSPPVVVGDGVE